jgi:hypothetical protein
VTLAKVRFWERHCVAWMTVMGAKRTLNEGPLGSTDSAGRQLRGGKGKRAGDEPLHLSAFGQRERVFDINPEITDGAFDLCVPKEDLNSAQIARCLVDDGRLRSAK